MLVYLGADEEKEMVFAQCGFCGAMRKYCDMLRG